MLRIMARAIVFNGANFELVKKEVPKPRLGHVVVRITIRPILPADLYLHHQVFQENGKPIVPGYEGFGIVHSIGEGVTKLKVGQRVTPFLHHGTQLGEGSWQDYVEISEDAAWPVPDSVTDEAASQFVINPWTAYGVIEDLQVPKGEYLLQTAAGSVLGRHVIQMAKHYWGIKTINVVRRAEQKAELKALGADEVISSSDEDVVSRVKEITHGKLVSGAIDAIGGEFTKTVGSCVRSGGTVFVYGALGGTFDATVRIFDLFRGVKLLGWGLSNYIEEQNRQTVFTREVGRLMEEKVVEPLSGERFDLADIEEALKYSEKNTRGGKVLLTG
jgi:NADPH:quinone reductase-like Zn-dependent oxidoreductase